ncbi:N-acetylmuramoyl-L-alanine amidase [Pseudohoeflea coraliihabitans]|uniref:N-acetylmuramoyl-L-alanine amidase n=1 Tax=Pseudohoeflea coraliihabitans TaxID=2860393 RepID=A0ABS6WTK3_9HYPH|nr:N-acetylmuramoyl-L-alanine amidase [Pseudohoeflea sp. DP4N28-3]MBW3098943.1 N-acetylmuramoyl-L-alanine amidase [Pseudohoeflea sp. DP4N28-3]
MAGAVRRASGAFGAFAALTCALWLSAFVAGAASQENNGRAAAERIDGALAFAARLVADAERARLLIDFETPPTFKVRYLDSPARIVVELSPSIFAFDRAGLKERGLVRTLRFGDAGPDKARLVLELAGPARLEKAAIEPLEGGGGHRLVLDAVVADQAAFSALVDEADWLADLSEDRSAPSVGTEMVIVIDPGHGGIDGGAEGVQGTQEKDVTLAFARALRDALNDLDNIRTVLTRSDDSFLSLSGRLRAAHQAEADLLLSIHADSIRLRRLRGATVYTLSDRASDAVAAALLEQEDEAVAMIGAEIEHAPDSVAGILVDMARNETRVLSTGLASEIVASFEGQVRLINNPHRQAGFRVLQSPDLPSALIELGYLSNPEDEKLLTDAAWRRKAAELLAASIAQYRDTILAAGE